MGITLEPNTWYQVKVIGGIYLEDNPEYLNVNPTPGPMSGQTLPPWGEPSWSAGQVSFKLKYTDDGTWMPGGIVVVKDTTCVNEGNVFLYTPREAELRFSRKGISLANSGGGAYLLVGSQTAVVTKALPGSVTADKYRVPLGGDTVTFTLQTVSGNLMTAEWYYLPGDTLATPDSTP